MKVFLETLIISLGAALGANARYWLGVWSHASTQTFPWPTMLINVIGSTLLGAFSAYALMRGWGWQSRLFFAVGLCGGFTTFSTFSYEVVTTFFERGWKLAGLYAIASFVLCVAGCFGGAYLARSLAKPPVSSNPFKR